MATTNRIDSVGDKIRFAWVALCTYVRARLRGSPFAQRIFSSHIYQSCVHSRFVWFVGLWLVSVSVLGVVAMLIRWGLGL